MKVPTVFGMAATAIVAATAAQMIHIGTASATPAGRLVVLDVRTGRVVTTEATPTPRVTVLDVRTGRIITPGYEFFLAPPPMPLTADTAASTTDHAAPSIYTGDGKEFRLNN